MKQILIAVVAIAISCGNYSMAQANPERVKTEFPGSCLKWIHLAEVEFEHRNLDVNNYIISVFEKSDSVVISLSSPDQPNGARGSTGKYPGFEVEIGAKNLKILRSNYIR